MTTSLDDLLEHLKKQLPKRENVLFGHSKRNLIGPRELSLFDTPHKHEGWTNPRLGPDHSTHILHAIAGLVGSATRYVDILTMERPTGDFFQALLSGFERIFNANLPDVVTVRLLMGKMAETDVFKDIDVEGMLKEIAARLNGRTGKLDIYVGQIRWELASWNHAKVIAVDKARMMVGGHNMWDADYLRSEPVFDISMRVNGELTEGAHQFAEALWSFVRKHNIHRNFSHRLNPSLQIEKNVTPGHHGYAPGVPEGSMPALWVTCPGWGIFYDEENKPIVKDGNFLCFEKAMQKATHCRMSLQDIGSKELTAFKDFDEHHYDGHPYRLIACKGFFFQLELIDAYAEFLARNSTNRLHIVLTSPGRGGKDGYSHQVPPSVIYNVLSYRMWKKYGVSKRDCLKKFNPPMSQLVLGAVSFKDQNHWPGGTNQIRNHAKFWMIDGRLMYLGSGNFYPHIERVLTENKPGHHFEFGMVADLPLATAQTIAGSYFDPMLKHSHKVRAEESHMTWSETSGAEAAE